MLRLKPFVSWGHLHTTFHDKNEQQKAVLGGGGGRDRERSLQSRLPFIGYLHALKLKLESVEWTELSENVKKIALGGGAANFFQSFHRQTLSKAIRVSESLKCTAAARDDSKS